jgi:phosphoribosylanthranilate isomerase
VLAVRVKICGITSFEELRMAEWAGAHAVGFLVGRLHASRDFLEPDHARDLARTVPPFLVPVLVTHVADGEEILALAARVPTAAVQLHSDLPARALQELRARLAPRKVIGKVSVEDESAIARSREIEGSVDAIVLDSRDRASDRVGGTGTTHDWSISARIVAASRVPVILAGGLTPENVAQAVRVVRPFAVDVNSGVETSDGRKDPSRLARFVAATRA